MDLISLASSSSGNAYLYDFSGVKILVDLGISYKNLKEKLNEVEVVCSELSAILLTHEHTDHIKGLEVFCKNENIPIFLTKGTDESLKFDLENKNIVMHENEFFIENVKISPFNTSHDATEPVCYVFEWNNKRFGHITDTGYVGIKLQEKINNLHFYLIESNYDEKVLLKNDKYPFIVKKRINSDRGHLSNVQTKQYLKELIGEDTEVVCFGHLSENNNDPELVEIMNDDIDVEKYVLKKDSVVRVTCK